MRDRAAVAIALAVAAMLCSLADGGWPARTAAGQGPGKIEPSLSRTMERSAPDERIPVLVEIDRVVGPDPLSPTRELRAAEHASDLASRYESVRSALERNLPARVRAEVSAAPLLWAGGALAVQLNRDEIAGLAVEPQVQRVYYDGLVEVDLAAPVGAPGLPYPTPLTPAAQDPSGGLPEGLRLIGAPTLWAAGATGQGTVVAIIDSGVDADHPLLAHKWRGLTAPGVESWFDPWGLTAVPVDDDNSFGVGHGTIVATVAVGSLEPGDTLLIPGGPQPVGSDLDVVTGVAPGSRWIAANAFENFGGGDYTRLSILLQAMQWALDPDGDPASVTDVPDVVNNSWGFRSEGCDDLFDRAIDALELVGIPVVFAAGNRAGGLDTVAAPAHRADLLLNAFAVGAVEVRDGDVLVAPNSLGGPSPCAPGAIKPEVVAPGEIPVVARASDNVAQLLGGSSAFTSWAAPHVSGALAVLRGLAPQASSGDLKGALFATASDLPPAGLDNLSGAGLIDLPAAAERVGGLGGVRLTLTHWDWAEAERSLEVHLHNVGRAGFPGGQAELRRRVEEPIARTGAPAVESGRTGTVTFRGLPNDLSGGDRLILQVEGGGGTLAFGLTLASAPRVNTVTLVDGPVRFSLDGNGRIGRVAGPIGFQLDGTDWLAGGGVLVVRGDRVSDGVYVDVLRQPGLKVNPVGSDTDWFALEAGQEGGQAVFRYSDDRALEPLGVTIDQTAEVAALGDSAAFVLLEVRTEFRDGWESTLAGVLLDWDFPAGDSVFWDPDLGASVMTARDGEGPWMALATGPRPPTTHSAIPLGTPTGGFYRTGDEAGVLARTEGFTDEEKSRFLRLGGTRAPQLGVLDWSHLVAVGPLVPDERVDFLIAAGLSRGALVTALEAARTLAAARGSGDPTAARGTLELLPPFPNPYEPGDGRIVRVPYLVRRADETMRIRFRIYTISGRRVFEERRDLTPFDPIEPFTWDGRLESGELAASGVYGYILEADGQKRMGKFLLLK